MVSLFFSYSRKDIDFARRLTEAFKDQDLDFWIDWEDIPPTVNWWKEIEKGIEEADIFLFLLSSDSAKSKVCKQEIEHAARNGKRLIPVVIRDCNADEAPAELKQLNWIFLRENDNFSDAFGKLMTAIRTDYEWVQIHRQLQVKALEWERSGDENSFLLRGKELQDAEFQLATNSSKEPYPTDLQREYVLKSRQVTDKQRRTITSIAAAGIIALAALATFGFIQARIATTNAQQAQAASTLAVANEATAVANEVLAKEQANIALARQLAAQSQVNLEDHPELSLLLAIESMQTSEDALGSYLPAAERALRQSLSQIKIGGQPLPGNGEPVLASAFSQDGKWLATGAADGKVYLWDLQNSLVQPIILSTEMDIAINNVEFSKDGHWLATNTGTWDVQNISKEPMVLQGEDIIQAFDLSPDGQWQAISTVNDLDNTSQIIVWEMKNASLKPIIIYEGKYVLSDLTFSPYGRWLAAIHRQENTLYLWDIQSNFSERYQMKQNGYINQVIFSPDERWLGLTSADGVVVWNMQDTSTEPKEHIKGDFNNLAFSTDGMWLALTSDDGILVWNLHDTSAEPKELIRGNYNNLAFSTDGKWLATDKWVWNMNELSHEPIPLEEDFVAMLNFSPDGNWLATRSNCNIHLRNAQDFSADPIVLHGHELMNCAPGGINGNWLTSSSFSSNGRWLATTDMDSVTWLWDLQNISTEPLTLQYGYGINDIAFSPDGYWLGVGSNENHVVHLWDIRNLSSEPITLSEDEFNFSPNGRWLVTLSHTNESYSTIHLRDMQNLSKEIPLPNNGNINTFSFSPDGNQIAIGYHDENIYLIDMRNPSSKIIISKNQGVVGDMVFSQTGHWLAVVIGENEDHVNLWNTKDLALKQIIMSGKIGTLDFSPDEHWLVASMYEKGIHLIDMTDFSKKANQLSDTDDYYPLVLVFSPPDGRWMAIGDDEGFIYLWDTWNFAISPIRMRGNRDPIDSLIFSNDGQMLVSGALGGSVFIWDMQDVTKGITTEPIVVQHPNLIGAIAISPDRQWLATGSYGPGMADSGDRTVRLWHLNMKELLTIACQMVSRNFTRTEWTQYFPDKPYPAQQADATCPKWPLELVPAPTPSLTP